MPTPNDPFADLTLTDQDLGPIEPRDESLASPPPSQHQAMPAHWQRRSLDRESELWEQILKDPRDEIWLKISAKREQAKLRQTRFYHSRSFIMESYRRNNYHDLKDIIAAYSIAIRKHDTTYYLVFHNLGLTADELLDPLT